MAFDFPASPTTGQVYAPTGGPAYQWDGEKWKGGQPSGPQTEQFFDLVGKTQLDIPVPTWAKGVTITGCIYLGAAGSSGPLLQLSLDGTTFVGSGYNFAGPWHSAQGAAPGVYSSFTQTAAGAFLLAATSDNASVPTLFTSDLNLIAVGGEYFSCRSVATNYINAAPSTTRTTSLHTYLPGPGTIKALRFGVGPAAVASSWLRVKWLGDAASIPNGPVVIANDGYNGSTTYTPGTTVVTVADDHKLFTMTLGAAAVFTLPPIADVPNGWSCLLKAKVWPSAHQTNYVAADAPLIYNGVPQTIGANNRFLLIGAEETFRFIKNVDQWLIELVVGPARVFSIVADGTGLAAAYANPPTTWAVAGAGRTIVNPAGAGIRADLGFVAPVSGVYTMVGRVYVNADGVGGATAGVVNVSLGDQGIESATFIDKWCPKGVSSGFYGNSTMKTMFMVQGSAMRTWFYANVSTLVYYPPNNWFVAYLESR